MLSGDRWPAARKALQASQVTVRRGAWAAPSGSAGLQRPGTDGVKLAGHSREAGPADDARAGPGHRFGCGTSTRHDLEARLILEHSPEDMEGVKAGAVPSAHTSPAAEHAPPWPGSFSLTIELPCITLAPTTGSRSHTACHYG
jgi:hypothetical protein